MKHTIIKIVSLIAIATTLFASSDAEVIFDNKCSMCHLKTIPTDRSSMIAPALFGVMRHVKMSYPNKEDAVDFIVDYVQSPSKDKAICMSQKIAHFGLMPSQKDNITPAELKKVSGWLFDNFPPANFRGQGMMQGNKTKNKTMMRGMQNRPTFEMFDANGDGKITPDEFNAYQNARMNKRMGN